MLKKVLIGISVLIVFAFIMILVYVLRPTSEASAPIEAIPVEVGESEPEAAFESAPENAGESTDIQESEEITTDTGVEEPASGRMVVFSIIPEESEARFILDEILRGAPTTVVGVTNQVAGEIAVDFDNPAGVQVGAILVNARTLVTDNDFRNRAINNEILDTRDYEFITFMPASISGLPENPQFGQELVFQINGDLTIRNITQSVTFDARVTVESEERLSGYASTVVIREDYDLNIPNVPSVADVDEEVLLEIELVATTR